MNETTIYDVAKHAGVAVSTVSKVISGRHAVSDKTREKVLQAIEQLNFVPRMAARTLTSERTNLIAVVISHEPDTFFSDPYLHQILYGINIEITDRDCALLLSMPRSFDDRASAYQRLLRGFRVDGVLVESGLGEEGATLLAERGYPCVVIGYSQHNMACIYPDDYQGARTMTRHLTGLGHKQLGVITGPNFNERAWRARCDGVIDELKETGLELSAAALITGDFQSSSGYNGVAELMALPNPPTAVFAFNDRMAIGAIHWLREHGYRIPQDVSVAGFDDIADAARCDPSLTTIHINPVSVGQQATRMLFDYIEQGTLPLDEIVLPVEFIQRQSTGPVHR